MKQNLDLMKIMSFCCHLNMVPPIQIQDLMKVCIQLKNFFNVGFGSFTVMACSRLKGQVLADSIRKKTVTEIFLSQPNFSAYKDN